MANSRMGPIKAQCVHAVAVLWLSAAATSDPEQQKIIITCTGILAAALGIDPKQAMEIVNAGAADLRTEL